MSASDRLGPAVYDLASDLRCGERDCATADAPDQRDGVAVRLGAGQIKLVVRRRGVAFGDAKQGVVILFAVAVFAAAFGAWLHRATISDRLSGVKS